MQNVGVDFIKALLIVLAKVINHRVDLLNQVYYNVSLMKITFPDYVILKIIEDVGLVIQWEMNILEYVV